MAANDDGLEGTDTTDSKGNSAFLPKDEGSIDCSQTKHENLFLYPFGIQSRISFTSDLLLLPIGGDRLRAQRPYRYEIDLLSLLALHTPFLYSSIVLVYTSCAYKTTL